MNHCSKNLNSLSLDVTTNKMGQWEASLSGNDIFLDHLRICRPSWGSCLYDKNIKSWLKLSHIQTMSNLISCHNGGLVHLEDIKLPPRISLNSRIISLLRLWVEKMNQQNHHFNVVACQVLKGEKSTLTSLSRLQSTSFLEDDN